MRMIHKSFIVGLTLLLASCLSTTAFAKEVVFVKLADNFIILYDSSSSMKAKSGDQMRLDIERQILTEKILRYPHLTGRLVSIPLRPDLVKKHSKAIYPCRHTTKEPLPLPSTRSLPSPQEQRYSKTDSFLWSLSLPNCRVKQLSFFLPMASSQRTVDFPPLE